MKENQSVTQKSYLGRTEFPDCVEIDMFEEQRGDDGARTGTIWPLACEMIIEGESGPRTPVVVSRSVSEK